jgi:hypothetical protein
MGSMFNSEVYRRRNHTPWAEIKVIDFACEMAVQGSEADAALAQAQGLVARKYHSGTNDFLLIVQYRPDTSSRFWFVAKWTGADGKRHQAEGQTIELCMWRAAQRELDVQKEVDAKGGSDE